MTWAVLLLLGFLAFTNGANDNCKGVATLVGYGATTPRKALWWATLTTFLGAAFSFWFAGGLLKSFSTSLFTAGTSLPFLILHRTHRRARLGGFRHTHRTSCLDHPRDLSER